MPLFRKPMPALAQMIQAMLVDMVRQQPAVHFATLTGAACNPLMAGAAQALREQGVVHRWAEIEVHTTRQLGKALIDTNFCLEAGGVWFMLSLAGARVEVHTFNHVEKGVKYCVARQVKTYTQWSSSGRCHLDRVPPLVPSESLACAQASLLAPLAGYRARKLGRAFKPSTTPPRSTPRF